MPHYTFVTRHGPLVFVAADPRPEVLLIHGFGRAPGYVQAWSKRFDRLGFLYLPGHGRAAPLAEVSLKAWAEALSELIAWWARPPLIIGESLGALLALSVPSRATIAVEPPLSVDQLWPLHRTMAHARAKGWQPPVDPDLLFSTPFHDVLAGIAAPTLVIAGDIPLMPERPIRAEPSLLTDEDFAAYAAHPQVEAVRIAGGHNLLDSNPEGVMAASAAFRERHGFPPPPPEPPPQTGDPASPSP